MKRIFFLIVIIIFSCNQENTNTKVEGIVFGTNYIVQYQGNQNYEKQFDSLFHLLNRSMSTYIPGSDISKLNRNEPVEIDQHFVTVFKKSYEIYIDTKGIFDPTIGAVVNAWDFGPEGRIVDLDSLKIDSLMTVVGMEKVKLNGTRIDKPEGTYLDFSAIAKGYAVDVVSEFLEEENIRNYFVFIGGEVRAKGINDEKAKPWVFGIQDPNFDGEQSYGRQVSLTNKAMATSGVYRKFKIDENGNRYAHIINAKTGYPSKTNVLSVSVIADDCMTADAYATAFQAMGIDAVKTFLEEHKELQVYFIFENENGELETLSLNGFPEE